MPQHCHYKRCDELKMNFRVLKLGQKFDQKFDHKFSQKILGRFPKDLIRHKSAPVCVVFVTIDHAYSPYFLSFPPDTAGQFEFENFDLEFFPKHCP